MENKAKVKAEELVAAYLNAYAFHTKDSALYVIKKAVEFALICVEEIIKSAPNNFINPGGCSGIIESPRTALVFWQEVKEHLKKMK